MWPFRRRPQSVNARPKFSPAFEALEVRFCLDSAPIVSFSVAPLAYGNVLISGQVTTDANQGGVHVNLGGVVSDFADTDTDGAFSVITRATSLGLIDASVTDPSTNATGDNQQYLSVPPPTITSFQITGGVQNGLFTFRGSVGDAWAPGELVTFSGLGILEGHPTTVQSDGSFAMSMLIGPGQVGVVTVHVWDFWGQTSTANSFLNSNV